MAVQASPTRRTATTRRSPSNSNGKSAGTSPPARQARRVASTSAEQGRQVASRSVDQGQQVASTAKDQGQAVARTARDQGQAVARVAAGSARDVTGTVKEQAYQVREELAAQGRTVVHETRSKLQQETEVQARRAADGLSRLADEVRALAEGRPEEAVTVRDYVAQGADKLVEAADRIAGLADEVEEKGIDGLVDDLKRFARRRPGAFLLGAAVAGFGVGRIVRAGGDDDDDDEVEPLDGDGYDGRRAAGGARPRSLSNGRRALPAAGAASRTRARAGR